MLMGLGTMLVLQYSWGDRSSIILSIQEKMERKEAKLNQKRQEIEHLKRNASVADGTIRKLRIQNTQLEAEKTKLVNDSHKYANTKLEQTEKERAALLKQVEEQEQIMSSMDARANQLNQQNRALEEQVRVLGKVREEKEHLEQKLISQTATIQNIEQVCLYVCLCLYTCMYINFGNWLVNFLDRLS